MPEQPSRASKLCVSLPCAVSAAALVFLFASPVGSHPLAPSLLELKETLPGEFEVLWRTPLRRAAGVDLSPELPEHCRDEDESTRRRGETGFEVRWRVVCGEKGLEGSIIAVRGLEKSRTAALLQIHWNDREPLHVLLEADQPEVEVGAPLTRLAVARSYTMLGAKHILLGPDHLLFVL